jgi:hypothetical protein
VFSPPILQRHSAVIKVPAHQVGAHRPNRAAAADRADPLTCGRRLALYEHRRTGLVLALALIFQRGGWLPLACGLAGFLTWILGPGMTVAVPGAEPVQLLHQGVAGAGPVAGDHQPAGAAPAAAP